MKGNKLALPSSVEANRRASVTGDDVKEHDSEGNAINTRASLYMEKTSASLGSGLIRSTSPTSASISNSTDTFISPKIAAILAADSKAESSTERDKNFRSSISNDDAFKIAQDDALDQLAATKIRKFLRFLEKPDVEMSEVRKLAWSGVPDALRQVIWLMLLEVIPLKKSKRNSALEKRRQEYNSFVDRYYQFNKYETNLTPAMKQMRSQIAKDVPRTKPGPIVFDTQKIQNSLERLLYVWAMRHPASGYVQGINDLATPFYYVYLACTLDGEDLDSLDIDIVEDSILLQVEADTFWSLNKLFEGIQENYTFAQPGIQKMLFALEELIRRIDEPLHKHFTDQGISFTQFAYRWMNCYLLRELPFTLILRMFDSYLAEEGGSSAGFSNTHVYFCAALLISFSAKIKQLEFQDLMLFIQHLPSEKLKEDDISSLLSQAFVYQQLFESSPSHFSKSWKK